MDSHLQATKPQTKNRRNGKMPKLLQTEYGHVEIETPRDRDGSFSPEIIQKRQTILAEGISDKIISLYATGQSMSDIQVFLEENYGTEILFYINFIRAVVNVYLQSRILDSLISNR